MRRGRPPYPDVLTPRQQQILELLRQGRTNEEIAETLGISRDGAKYHVSEILSRLGVSTRQEAAAWRPEDVAITRERRWGVAAVLPFLRRPPTLTGKAFMKAGGALAVTGGVAIVAVLAVGVLVMEQRSGTATAPIAPALPSRTPIPNQEQQAGGPPLPTREPLPRPDESFAMSIDEARIELSRNADLSAVIEAAESGDAERLLALAVSVEDYCRSFRELPPECSSRDDRVEAVYHDNGLIAPLSATQMRVLLNDLIGDGTAFLEFASRDSRYPEGDGGQYYLFFRYPKVMDFGGGYLADGLALAVTPGTGRPIEWFVIARSEDNALKWIQLLDEQAYRGALHHILVGPESVRDWPDLFGERIE